MICRILIVDDEEDILSIAKRYFEKRDMEVVTTNSGKKALALAKKMKPDLVIADVEMPDSDGRNLCLSIKKTPGLKKTPVIIMSGKKISEKDILEGYAKGSNDYVIKPFSFPVLLAKVKNLLMLYDKCSGMVRHFREWNLKIDYDRKELFLKNRKVNLTRKEFGLLSILLEKKGKVAGNSYLLENVWGYEPALYNNPHTIEVHVSSLRKKLGRGVGGRIKKVTGYGYKFETGKE